MRLPPLLVDTNVIIEAVRTSVWAAISGQRLVATVEACRDEALAAPADLEGYIRVTEAHLGRLHAIHVVDGLAQASLKLAYADADALDRGEHDLLAHAIGVAATPVAICTADKAAIRAAMSLGLGDQLTSLEQIADSVGVRPKLPLRRQYQTHWLISFRSQLKAEGL